MTIYRAAGRGRLLGLAVLALAWTLAAPAMAQLSVDDAIVDFNDADQRRTDVQVRNTGEETLYVSVTPRLVENPGTPDERRVEIKNPRDLGLLTADRDLGVADLPAPLRHSSVGGADDEGRPGHRRVRVVFRDRRIVDAVDRDGHVVPVVGVLVPLLPFLVTGGRFDLALLSLRAAGADGSGDDAHCRGSSAERSAVPLASWR